VLLVEETELLDAVIGADLQIEHDDVGARGVIMRPESFDARCALRLESGRLRRAADEAADRRIVVEHQGAHQVALIANARPSRRNSTRRNSALSSITDTVAMATCPRMFVFGWWLKNRGYGLACLQHLEIAFLLLRTRKKGSGNPCENRRVAIIDCIRRLLSGAQQNSPILILVEVNDHESWGCGLP